MSISKFPDNKIRYKRPECNTASFFAEKSFG